MLMKIHSKLTGRSCSYVPLSQSKRQMSDSGIGDGPFFVCKLLDKMSRSSTDCARAIEEVYTSLNPREASGSGKKPDNVKDEERSEQIDYIAVMMSVRLTRFMITFAARGKESTMFFKCLSQ